MHSLPDSMHKCMKSKLKYFMRYLIISTLIHRQVAGLFLLDPMVETVFDDNSSWAHHW